jgi:2-dehydropantoate 2-reductase
MRVAVVGPGGVGGYFGACLARSGDEVTMIGRGAHLAAIREHGLTIRTPEEEFRVDVAAEDDPSRVGPVDAVLFCVKSYDTDSAAARLSPLLAADTAVLSLQNGVDNEDRIAAALGRDHVLGGAAFLFASITEPGTVTASGPRRIVFGELDGVRRPRTERLLEAFRTAGVDAEITDSVDVALWSKYAFLCALAGATAAIRLPIGEIRASPAASELLRGVLEEVCRVGRAVGVALPDDLVERHLAFAAGLEAGAFSSLHHDLVTGHRMELAALHGTVLRLARGHDVDTPWTRTVYAVLEPWAQRNEPPDQDTTTPSSAVATADTTR